MLAVITGRLGVSSEALETVRHAFASADQTRAATELLSALITVAVAVSFTTALQRVYLRAWRRPPGGGVRNKGRGAVWVGGFVLLMIVVSVVRSLIPGPSWPVLSWAVGLIGATGLWWWTSRLMLRGEVRWRALLPTLGQVSTDRFDTCFRNGFLVARLSCGYPKAAEVRWCTGIRSG